MSMNDVLPICYRCDNKYKEFLLTSIESLLKYYRGERRIKFYICTNDDLKLDELALLQSRYNFDYEIITINGDYIRSHNIIGDYATMALRKFCGFTFNTTEVDIFTHNPFNRSKLITALWVFFLATTKHEKVLCIDTDTLIVEDISTLYDTDVSKVYLASCYDWCDPTTFNPSVSIVNVKKVQQAYLKFGMQIAKQMTTRLFTVEDTFCDVFQNIVNDVIGKDWIVLDQAWNMPITHMHNFNVKPKIYHFSESWRGIPLVVDTYKRLLAEHLAKD